MLNILVVDEGQKMKDGLKTRFIKENYKLNEVEFQVYIKDLADAGYIRIELHNNIEYYFATNKSNEFLKSKKPQELVKSCIGLITESAVKGFTSACLEKVIA